MLKKDKWKRIRELESQVRFHNRKYFEENNPVISDYEFDLLVEELKKLSPNSGVLVEIGNDFARGRKKINHEIPMLSLDKCYDDKALEGWASKFEGDVVTSPKIDGLALSLCYDSNGELVLASTRGNGLVGDEMTMNAREIRSIPPRIKLANVEVRGEAYMPLSIFAKYREEFANPRNLAAGAVKQKDPKKTADYNLGFFAYDLFGVDVKSEEEKFKILEREGFAIIEHRFFSKRDMKTAFEYFIKKRDGYDFETDGVVYKANSISEQSRIGNTAHHPRYAIAYKFQGDSGVTTLLDVEWSVSRSGVITPIGIVEPVELSGAMVKRCSLHNVGWMMSLNLEKGAKVLMMRRGGVIPHLESVVERGRGKIDIPQRCPSCGGAVEVRDDFLHCKNPKNCLSSKIGELSHFIKTIRCDGFGSKLIERLYTSGMVTEPDDFFSLTESDLLELERMGEVLAHKLISNIQAKRELRLDVFLQSLGIRELGKNAAKILAEFGALKRIRALETSELSSVHGVGDVIANEVVNGLKRKENLIERLLKHVQLIENKAFLIKKGKLSGKVFLFTGALNSMSRLDVSRRVEEMGATVASAVNKGVDYLVVGDAGGAGSKLEKAKRLMAKGGKIKIISENEFKRLFI